MITTVGKIGTMNNRFIKLATDAGLLNYIDHETPRRYFINGNAEQEEVEMFAQLIIEECGVALSPMLRDMVSRVQAYDLIKQHFGVE